MHPSTNALSLDEAVRNSRVPIGLSRWFSAAILVLMGLVAAILLWRRLAGALAQPLPAETLVVLGVSFAAMASAARWAWRREENHAATGRAGRLVAWCPTALLLLIALAVHLPGTSTSGMIFFWLALVLEEAVMGPWRGRRSKGSVQRVLKKTKSKLIEQAELSDENRAWPIGPTMEARAEGLAAAIIQDEKPLSVESLPEAQVTQQFVRSHSAESGDVFSGWLRVEMPPGARTTNVHVAFCPPFAHTPAIEVHQVDGPTGRIKTIQALPYGARLDFKLSRSSEQATSVLLRLVASLTEG